MILSLPLVVLKSYFKSATTPILSVLNSGMKAATDSVSNDGRHT